MFAKRGFCMGKPRSRCNHRSVEYFRSRWHYGFLLLIVFSTVWVRLSLIDLPLERDEGEYAYAGQLILQGSLPYDAVYNMKLPGVYAAYAGIIGIFGQTHRGVHTGLAVINIATIVLLFFLGRKLADTLAGLMASASFAVLSLTPVLQGIFANSEHFVILPVIGGLILLLGGLEKDRLIVLFTSGLLFGTGVLMKQHGALFGMFALLFLVIDRLQAKKTIPDTALRGILFLSGIAVPYALVCLFFKSVGIFDKFWFWTVSYASKYTAEVSLGLGWEMFRETAADILRADPFVWLIAGIGLSAPLWSRKARQRAVFTHGLFLFSFLSVIPGLYFRRHYFLLLVPSASLLFGMAVSAAQDKLAGLNRKGLAQLFPAVLSAVVLVGSFCWHGYFMMGKTPLDLSRYMNGLNPFPEALDVGSFIRENSSRDDRIAVIGSEPQIYFYSGRRAATGYIYMYPLMESHEFALTMQKDMLREIEEIKPKFLVFVHVDTSWGIHEGSQTMMLSWLDQYQSKYYWPVGVIDIREKGTEYYWAPNLKGPPESSQWIAVFQRKSDASI